MLRQQWDRAQSDETSRQKFGNPWGHPVLVMGVDNDGIVTLLQMTSRDVIEGASSRSGGRPNLNWARRYMPIYHHGVARHPDASMPRLQLATSSQMEKASSVNVETALYCEWRNLECFFFGKRVAPMLTGESMKAVEHHRACYQAHPLTPAGSCAAGSCLPKMAATGLPTPPTTPPTPRAPIREPSRLSALAAEWRPSNLGKRQRSPDKQASNYHNEATGSDAAPDHGKRPRHDWGKVNEALRRCREP